MSRPGIDYEQVRAAAVSLLKCGANPSIQRIRELLGTGSNSTIGRHLKQWQQELIEPPKIALPVAVPEAALVALEQFWKVAIEQADAHYQALREQASQAVTLAEQARDAALMEADKNRTEAADLRQRLATSETEVRELQDFLLVERERKSHAEAATAVAEQQAETAARVAEQVRSEAAARLQDLEHRLVQTVEDRDKRLLDVGQQLQYERERSEANATQLLKIIAQNRSDRAAEQQAFGVEKATWQARETTLHKRSETLGKELAALGLRAASAEEKARVMDAEIKHARQSLHDLQEQYLEAVRSVEALRGDLKVAANERHVLQETLVQCRHALESANLPTDAKLLKDS